MKAKHNVIPILVSSSKFNSCFPEWFIISYSQFEMLYLFFSRSSKFSQLFHREDPSKSLQGFTLCFQLLFPFVWSFFYHRSSSWRLYMMVHQGFNSFSKFSLRFFSEELKFSSSCYPECNSFFRIIGGGIMSLLIIWVHFSRFTCCQEWDILILQSHRWSYLGLFFT